MLHHGEHAPVQLFRDLEQAPHLKLAHLVDQIAKPFQFKHLLCYLCSVVNKILVHVI